MFFEKKPFFVGAFAIVMVFSVLLVGIAMQIQQDELDRPKICDCFVYDGNYHDLQKRLENELAYVDRIILLQGGQSEGRLSDQEKKELLAAYKDRVVTVTISQTRNLFQEDYLKGLIDWSNRDVILLSRSQECVDFKELYGALGQISKSMRIYSLKNSFGKNEEIRALNYELFKTLPNEPLDNLNTTELEYPKKRRFFFQTSYHPPKSKEELGPCF